MAYQPIESYGVVGDENTVALVGMDGSIDFMCFPDFDSPSIFAAMLDDEKGGHFRLAPVLEDARHRQLYLPDTNILITRFLAHDGVGEVSDFMPVEELGQAHQLVRRAKTVRGDLMFRMICAPRFDYGRAAHRVEVREGEVLFFCEGEGALALRLTSAHPVRVENGAAIAEFELKAGETASFVLEDARQESRAREPGYVAESFKQTMNYWRSWIQHSNYRGRWREMVDRSALTLKMLTSSRHGSIIAAPTFSLPEEIGGVRNWDYRYTWIRDASFTLYALMRLGYTNEARDFMKWIEARCADCREGGLLQIMYGIDGRTELPEETLEHFEGYEKTSPVRIGNAAHDQLQLDIYGELMDSVYIYNKYGEPISYDFWMNLTKQVDWVCENWERPDAGIWETRGGAKPFTFSRVLCWVAIDRAIRLAGKRSFPAPLERWHEKRDAIYRFVYEECWSEEMQAFTQYPGSDALDASCLLMPMVKFISPTDPRWLSTLAAIERDLVVDSLVYRYSTDEAVPVDGLTGGEGTFTMCSFWYAECVSRSGDIEKARFIFEKALGYANHVGLYAEELGPRGEHLGNFPQAFTHLALISAAYNLNEKLSAR